MPQVTSLESYFWLHILCNPVTKTYSESVIKIEWCGIYWVNKVDWKITKRFLILCQYFQHIETSNWLSLKIKWNFMLVALVVDELISFCFLYVIFVKNFVAALFFVFSNMNMSLYCYCFLNLGFAKSSEIYKLHPQFSQQTKQNGVKNWRSWKKNSWKWSVSLKW